MRKNVFFLTGMVVLGVIFSACSNNVDRKDVSKGTDSTAVMKDSSLTGHPVAAVYTCKMNPEVISDKPGKCPKCGMGLVKKESLEKR
ncbi:MAG TPA: heavy metal-binding domain-containing protein [Puia sp.]|jgi:ssDNA-binding Zn-finger/Zn-ribbon topoisomerase 1